MHRPVLSTRRGYSVLPRGSQAVFTLSMGRTRSTGQAGADAKHRARRHLRTMETLNGLSSSKSQDGTPSPNTEIKGSETLHVAPHHHHGRISSILSLSEVMMEKIGLHHHTQDYGTAGDHPSPSSPAVTVFKERLMEKLSPPVYEIVVRKDDHREPHGILQCDKKLNLTDGRKKITFTDGLKCHNHLARPRRKGEVIRVECSSEVTVDPLFML